jgi:hypothetical protein
LQQQQVSYLSGEGRWTASLAPATLTHRGSVFPPSAQVGCWRWIVCICISGAAKDILKMMAQLPGLFTTSSISTGVFFLEKV